MAKGDQIKILLGYLEQKDYPKALAYVKKHPQVFQAGLKAMTEEIIPYWGDFAVSLSKDDSHIEEPIYRRIIELDPDDATTHNNLGILLKAKGDLEGAEKHLRKAIELNPNYAAAHDKLGVLLHNQEKLKEAEAEYRKAIEADPKHTKAHYKLGVLLHNQEKLKEAEAEYRKAIEVDPKHTRAYYNLGVLYHNQKRLKEAEKEYRKAIELDPKLPQGYNNLGLLLQKRDDLLEAEEIFTKALKYVGILSPDDQKVVATNLTRLWLDMGYLACQLGDFEDFSNKAERLLELLKKHPIHPDKKNELYSNAYFLSGILDLQANQHEKAIKHFRTAARFNTKDARIYHNLAVAYCSAKKFKQASQSIQAAIDIKKEAKEENDQTKRLQEKIDKALNPIRIRWWRYIPFTCTFIFWLIPAIWGKCLFPQSKDGILSLMMVITFLASAVFLLAPVLPYVKKIGIAKVGDIEIDLEAPGKWDYSSLTEMRQTMPAKSADSTQTNESTRNE